jgi:hypothetical protein
MGAPLTVELCQVLGRVGEHRAHIDMDALVGEPSEDAVLSQRDCLQRVIVGHDAEDQPRPHSQHLGRGRPGGPLRQ